MKTKQNFYPFSRSWLINFKKCLWVPVCFLTFFITCLNAWCRRAFLERVFILSCTFFIDLTATFFIYMYFWIFFLSFNPIDKSLSLVYVLFLYLLMQYSNLLLHVLLRSISKLESLCVTNFFYRQIFVSGLGYVLFLYLLMQ